MTCFEKDTWKEVERFCVFKINLVGSNAYAQNLEIIWSIMQYLFTM